ncbi:MAG TPA: sulfatase/phosphatase domain-containing protein [Verrucomicrobiae bacterium]|nr:sulfatase/phosphatase domain-containing protein [Verrucomicrobiae bacterium]
MPDIATQKYFELYPLEKITLPKEPPDHIASIPPIALTCKPLNYGVAEEKLRTFKRAYFASISFVDLCGLKPPANLEGTSLRPLLENPKARWTQPAIIQHVRQKDEKQIMGYSVRTERWRYTEWDGGEAGAELYDHNRDPHEWHNLASDAKQAGTIAELKKLLPKAAADEIPPKGKKKRKKA